MYLTKYLVRIMNLAVFGFTALIIVSLFRRTTFATVFNFNFTWLSVVYLVAIVVAAMLVAILGRRGGGNRTVFWFIIYVITVAAYMLANLLKGASADHTTYIFWYRLLDFTGIIIAPFFLAFVFHYTNRQDILYRPITWLALFGTTFLTIPLTGNGTIFSDPARAVRYTFGFPSSAPAGSAEIFSILWSTAILLVGMILLVVYYNEVKAIASKRKQARLFIIAAIAPLAIGFIDVGILPLFDINLPLEPFFSMFQIALIGYALFRYKLFSIDPTALADTILETVNEGIITLNPEKEIEYLNEAAVRLTNKSLKAVRGHHLSSIFGARASHRILLSMQPDSVAEPFELELELADKQVPISLATSKIISKGDIDGYVLVFHDISRERAIKRDIEHQVVERTSQLNDEHAKLEAAMDSLDVGLLMTFKDTDVISYNTMLPKILFADKRTHRGALTLKTLEEKFKQSSFDLLAAIETCQRTGKPFDVKEITYGSEILRVYGAPIGHDHSSRVIGTVVLVESITEVKIQERSRDEFFSIASHELRTPLTSIMGNTSMILQYYPEALKDNSLKEMIDDIHSSSVRLIEIVNDFLDVSRLEQSKISFDYEATSIEEITEAIVYEIQVVLKSKGIYLKLDKKTLDRLPKVWADKNRLKQVIYNLLGNAAKFTEKGGITISAEIEGEFVKVRVSDTGAGMTIASQQLLFHKFQQASSSLLTRDTTRGTGLGLYISKMIVETMGGVIKLEESVAGKGTVFSFTVPVATSERQAAATGSAPLTDTVTGLSTKK
jgi:signal transduction histidine kinase/PAS domain-containing protein